MKLHIRHVMERAHQRCHAEAMVSGCLTKALGGGWFEVDVNHPSYPRNSLCEQAHPGPGTELKTLLAVMGIHASPTCKCNKMARQMNLWGAEESLNHIEDIVDVMEETAKARGLPFLRMAGKTLVKLACRRARQKAAQKDTNQ